jgi:signal transduction histidine kinase
MLRDFVAANRGEILAKARLRVARRSGPPAVVDDDRTRGLPVFLDQLEEALRKATAHEVLDHTEIQNSAHQHGHDLFEHGLTVDQVVHDYGDLCQVITGLAVDQGVSVAVEEFRTLNLCLDDAIAGAVTTYSQQRERAISDEGSERLGVLAHEMRNVLNTAILLFGTMKKGLVAPAGTTGAALDRSLIRLNVLIDRSLADVRLEAGMHNMEHVPVQEILDEVEIGAGLVAETRGIQFEVMKVDRTVIVEADRQILAAAVANLLLNAFKFTRPNSTVKLSAHATTSRVLIDVEDECGGLPADAQETILHPFVQKGSDERAWGLGCRFAPKLQR